MRDRGVHFLILRKEEGHGRMGDWKEWGSHRYPDKTWRFYSTWGPLNKQSLAHLPAGIGHTPAHVGHLEASTGNYRKTHISKLTTEQRPLTSRPYLYRFTHKWHSSQNNYLINSITTWFGIPRRSQGTHSVLTHDLLECPASAYS